MFKKIATIIFLFWTTLIIGQNLKQTNEVIEYLKQTREYSNKVISNGALQNISDIVLLQADILYNIGNNEWGGDPNSLFFVKTDKGLVLVGESMFKIPASIMFVASLKKSFKLKTEQDGIALQSVFYFFDQKHFTKGFFQKENKWYFIRHEMFGKAGGYIVDTDSKGNITEIVYRSKIELEIPEQTLAVDEKLSFDKIEAPKVEKADSLFMLKYINDKLNYHFEVSEIELHVPNNISNARFYTCRVIRTEGDEDNKYESINSCFVISFNGKFERALKVIDLIQSDLFSKSLKTNFKLSSETDAKIFETLIDSICVVSESISEQKSVYKKEDIWFFVRDVNVSDNEKIALMVLTDKKGAIICMDYNAIIEKNILRLRMKDKNFKVDYGFSFINPKSNQISVKLGESVPVKIQFNAMAANAKGAWILTNFDGKKVGMHAGTSIESPFSDEIPAKALTAGNHVVEYLLLPSGMSTENPIGKVILNINVN